MATDNKMPDDCTNLHLSHLWCEEAILPSRVFFSPLLSLLGWQFVLWAVLSCLFCFFYYKRQIVWMLALLTSPLHSSQRGSSSQYLHFCCHILLQQTGLLVCLHSLWLRSPVSQTCCPRPGVWLLLDVASMAIIEHPYVCVPLFTYCVFCDFLASGVSVRSLFCVHMCGNIQYRSVWVCLCGQFLPDRLGYLRWSSVKWVCLEAAAHLLLDWWTELCGFTNEALDGNASGQSSHTSRHAPPPRCVG